MSELWSIPMVRISVAVGFAVVFLVLLTPLWDRHFQTAGRRRFGFCIKEDRLTGIGTATDITE